MELIYDKKDDKTPSNSTIKVEMHLCQVLDKNCYNTQKYFRRATVFANSSLAWINF